MTSKKCLVLNLKTKKEGTVRRDNNRDTSTSMTGVKTSLSMKKMATTQADDVKNAKLSFDSTALTNDFFGRNKDLLIPSLHHQASMGEPLHPSLNALNPLSQYMSSNNALKRYSDALSSIQAQALLSAAASSRSSSSSFPPFIPSLPDSVAHNLLSVSGLLSGSSQSLSLPSVVNGSPDSLAKINSSSQEIIFNESMRHLLQVSDQKSKHLTDNSINEPLNISPGSFMNSKSFMTRDSDSRGINLKSPNESSYSIKKLKIDVPASIRDSIFGSNNNNNHNNFKTESDDDSRSQKGSSLDGDVMSVMMQGPGDNKKARVRSVLSEETLRILRAQYKTNPRPKKQDILRLSQQVNYSTRVVQVWFQNMRARDRRLGRPIVSNGNGNHSSSDQNRRDMESTTSAMTPPFTDDISFRQLMTETARFQGTSPLNMLRCPEGVSRMQMSPNRVTGCRQQPTDDKLSTDSPLDLSVRSTRSNDRDTDSSHELSPSHSPMTSNLSLQALGRVTSGDESFLRNNRNHDLSCLLKRPQSQGSNDRYTSQKESLDDLSKPSLPHNLFDSHRHHHHQWNASNKESDDDSSSRGSPSNDSSKDILALVSRSNNDLNKMFKMASGGEDSDGMEGNGINGLSSEPGGLFTCDQCDKTFSKQSSLARHKYEHSGQSSFFSSPLVCMSLSL